MSVIDEPLQFSRDGLPARPPAAGPARVTLVGAGPGDPELLTLKAHKAMQQARLVMVDHLVSEAVLAFLPAQARRIYVGKEATRHTLPQAAIIEQMVGLARSGQAVLRLKGVTDTSSAAAAKRRRRWRRPASRST